MGSLEHRPAPGGTSIMSGDRWRGRPTGLILLLVLLVVGCGQPRAMPSAPDATSVPPAPATTAPAPAVSPAGSSTVPAASVTPPRLLASSPSATPAPPPLPTPGAAPALPMGYPIGWPDQPPGAGFFIRHGYASENTWYNPGFWHTGEDWYAGEGDTAGAEVYAIAAGEVVYVGANYPGRVVIVRHAADRFSMYGHLDPSVAVAEGQAVARGTRLGTVLRRDDQVPNHLHVELRTFLTTDAVNGAKPRYGFRCGVSCPPGPGYWPIDAPDHPSDLGWRNPTHAIAEAQAAPGALPPQASAIVPPWPHPTQLAIWSDPPGGAVEPRPLGDLAVTSGQRFALLAVQSGPADSRETSAEAYVLWYQIALPTGGSGWVQAARPSTFETSGDGRPASVTFQLIPAVD